MASVTFNHRQPFKDLGVLSGNVSINSNQAEVFQIRVNENITSLTLLGRANVSLIFLSDNPDTKVYYNGTEVPLGVTQWVNIDEQWAFFQPGGGTNSETPVYDFASAISIIDSL